MPSAITTNDAAIHQASRAAGATIVAFPPLASVGTAAVVVVLLTAPFETTKPLLRMAGQSLSSVECVLLASFLVFTAVALLGRERLVLPRHEGAAWAAVVVAAAASAVFAPEFRQNALHMAGRFLSTAVLWVVAVTAGRSTCNRRRIASAALASGLVVAALCVADYGNAGATSQFLGFFREQTAVVGAQVRASGPFQYPTIASMFLEISFALGLGILVSVPVSPWSLLSLVLALGVIAEAIVLTFTRSGMLTMVVSLGLVSAMHFRRHGVDRRLAACAGVGVLLVVAVLLSRSTNSLALRLATEGQASWFNAAVEAPKRLEIGTRDVMTVRVLVTNTGLTTWDSSAPEPVLLSYHWIASNSDRVISWEGLRTPFARRVEPGKSVEVDAQVEGPGVPGTFRLMWDLEQRNRLWFSTEPGATSTMTLAEARGPGTAVTPTRGPAYVPRPIERPGRLILWSAALRMFAERPVLGVGADNYRLLYGRYSSVAGADPRVHSNNMYLEVIAGMGVVGAAAFLWLASRVAVNAWRTSQEGGLGLGVAAAVLAWGIHGLADSFLSFTPTYIAAAIVLGLVTASAQPERHRAHRV